MAPGGCGTAEQPRGTSRLRINRPMPVPADQPAVAEAVDGIAGWRRIVQRHRVGCCDRRTGKSRKLGALTAVDAGFGVGPGDDEHAEKKRDEQEDGEVRTGGNVAAGAQGPSWHEWAFPTVLRPAGAFVERRRGEEAQWLDHQCRCSRRPGRLGGRVVLRYPGPKELVNCSSFGRRPERRFWRRPHCDGWSAPCSWTIRTAHSRSSRKYLLGRAIGSMWALRQTRYGSSPSYT